ncbi:MAG: 30S ribosomal protein S2 [Candidatus Pacearchaeota archaeon]
MFPYEIVKYLVAFHYRPCTFNNPSSNPRFKNPIFIILQSGAGLERVVAKTPEINYNMIEKKIQKKIQKTESGIKEEPEESEVKISAEDVEGTKDQTILTPLEDYIKTASYLGTKVITPTMRKYVYRRRLDGLAILNTLLVDKKLSEAINFIKRFKPEDWTIVCKREAGWRAAKMFSELTGVRLFTKKYPAGILTNTVLDNFIETKMILICDPWLDKNSLNDARKVKIPIVGICDTNNHTTDIDIVIIGNNKSNKSLGLFFWLIAREYMKAQNINKPIPSLEDFVGEQLILEEPKKKKAAREKKEKELKEAEEAIEEKMKALAEEKGLDDEEIQVTEAPEEGV